MLIAPSASAIPPAAEVFSIESAGIIECLSGESVYAAAKRQLEYCLEITRPRIVLTVLITALTGYFLTASQLNLARFVNFLLGLTLISASANAFNQIIERKLDAQMIRTRRRPMAAGNLCVAHALLFACMLCTIGMALLRTVGYSAMLLGAIALIIYVLVYTPLKKRTPLSLYVGAIPGALPALIGTAATHHTFSARGLLLFGIVFFWQMPHFVAIGWLYRDDYARAGFRILSVRDGNGKKSAMTALLCSIALLLLLWVALRMHTIGPISATISIISAAALVPFAIRFCFARNSATARRLFIISNIFLMVVMLTAMLSGIFEMSHFKLN
jgi:protoheme IX farnesyltransferase